MDNQLMMDNYLLILKSTVEVYVHGTLESCNKKVHNLLNKSLDNTLSMQNTTFNLMTDYGWYEIDNVKKDIINNTINKIKS